MCPPFLSTLSSPSTALPPTSTLPPPQPLCRLNSHCPLPHYCRNSRDSSNLLVLPTLCILHIHHDTFITPSTQCTSIIKLLERHRCQTSATSISIASLSPCHTSAAAATSSFALPPPPFLPPHPLTLSFHRTASPSAISLPQLLQPLTHHHTSEAAIFSLCCIILLSLLLYFSFFLFELNVSIEENPN